MQGPDGPRTVTSRATLASLTTVPSSPSSPAPVVADAAITCQSTAQGSVPSRPPASTTATVVPGQRPRFRAAPRPRFGGLPERAHEDAARHRGRPGHRAGRRRGRRGSASGRRGRGAARRAGEGSRRRGRDRSGVDEDCPVRPLRSTVASPWPTSHITTAHPGAAAPDRAVRPEPRRRTTAGTFASAEAARQRGCARAGMPAGSGDGPPAEVTGHHSGLGKAEQNGARRAPQATAPRRAAAARPLRDEGDPAGAELPRRGHEMCARRADRSGERRDDAGHRCRGHRRLRGEIGGDGDEAQRRLQQNETGPHASCAAAGAARARASGRAGAGTGLSAHRGCEQQSRPVDGREHEARAPGRATGR